MLDLTNRGETFLSVSILIAIALMLIFGAK